MLSKRCGFYSLLTAVLLLTFTPPLFLPAQELTWFEADLEISNGLRVDNLDWTIAGNTSGENPNILSELIWSNLNIYRFEIAGRLFIYNVAFQTSFGYGWIFRGVNQDSDYEGDNRTLEFSRSNNSSDIGSVLDFSVGIGYRIRIAQGIFDITPLFGLSINEQYLTITDGFQTIPPLGAFEGLDSKYDTHWRGVWLGCDLALKVWRFSFHAGFQYRFLYYYAAADWNLRDDFMHPKSYEHEASGNGFELSAGIDFKIIGIWHLFADFCYLNHFTQSGIDRTFISDGTIAYTLLNGVNWNSLMISVGIAFHFENRAVE